MCVRLLRLPKMIHLALLFACALINAIYHSSACALCLYVANHLDGSHCCVLLILSICQRTCCQCFANRFLKCLIALRCSSMLYALDLVNMFCLSFVRPFCFVVAAMKVVIAAVDGIFSHFLCALDTPSVRS